MRSLKSLIVCLVFALLFFHCKQNLAWLTLEYPRLVNPQPTENPNRILAEVKKQADSTDNPSIVIDFTRRSMRWPSDKDKPIDLPYPQTINANYTYNIFCEIEQVRWKVYAPNGSLIIDQEVPMNCVSVFWPIADFSCFISERLKCAFFIYPEFQDSSSNSEVVNVIISYFGKNSSKLINITQENVYNNMNLNWEQLENKTSYSISDKLEIYDEEGFITYLSYWSPVIKSYYRFSIEKGLEFIGSRVKKASAEIWDIQNQHLIFLEERRVQIIDYNSSKETGEISIRFSERQLSSFLSKPLSFPPLQYLIIIPLLVVLFKNLRRRKNGP